MQFKLQGFGISADRAVDYLADSKGTELNFKVCHRLWRRSVNPNS